MKVYLITDEQINQLFGTAATGSRDFERMIQKVKQQEIKMDSETWEVMKKTLGSQNE